LKIVENGGAMGRSHLFTTVFGDLAVGWNRGRDVGRVAVHVVIHIAIHVVTARCSLEIVMSVGFMSRLICKEVGVVRKD
jgi:hypothetical protein